MKKISKTVLRELGPIKLFLVDDDAVFMKNLDKELLETADFEIITFSTGELCLENLHQNPDVIILDYELNAVNLDAMNGIAILDEILAFNPSIPVIMLSAQDEINVAVNCMHHDAFDYVVKSETSILRLQMIMTTIFQLKSMEKKLDWYKDKL
jgi:two-component system, OmpR family, response regulator